ncbi:MAG: TerB family tellurite resistance protein [Cyclobacteriaceae bacterium]|nr:TerB family tellurite resistance protein [Cyclobacteriaceae bacterium]
MKKLALNTIIWAVMIFVPVANVSAQSQEIAQLALNVQKLKQLKDILKQIKDGYEILYKGYNTIKDIAEGNYKVHKTHLDGLLNVSSTVKDYQRIKTIVQYQYALVNEYRTAYNRFGSSGNFKPQELTYMANVYNNLLNQSLKDLEELTTILTSGKTRMSDDERLQAIDRVFYEMEEKLSFLRDFNNSTSVLSLKRAREKADAKAVGILHGTQN